MPGLGGTGLFEGGELTPGLARQAKTAFFDNGSHGADGVAAPGPRGVDLHLPVLKDARRNGEPSLRDVEVLNGLVSQGDDELIADDGMNRNPDVLGAAAGGAKRGLCAAVVSVLQHESPERGQRLLSFSSGGREPGVVGVDRQCIEINDAKEPSIADEQKEGAH